LKKPSIEVEGKTLNNISIPIIVKTIVLFQVRPALPVEWRVVTPLPTLVPLSKWFSYTASRSSRVHERQQCPGSSGISRKMDG